jgi:hypothetical protein
MTQMRFSLAELLAVRSECQNCGLLSHPFRFLPASSYLLGRCVVSETDTGSLNNNNLSVISAEVALSPGLSFIPTVMNSNFVSEQSQIRCQSRTVHFSQTGDYLSTCYRLVRFAMVTVTAFGATDESAERVCPLLVPATEVMQLAPLSSVHRSSSHY